MSLAAFRRRGAPVALATYATLLANMLPVRAARADEASTVKEPPRAEVNAESPYLSPPAT
jgi:hypothetical protein